MGKTRCLDYVPHNMDANRDACMQTIQDNVDNFRLFFSDFQTIFLCILFTSILDFLFCSLVAFVLFGRSFVATFGFVFSDLLQFLMSSFSYSAFYGIAQTTTMRFDDMRFSLIFLLFLVQKSKKNWRRKRFLHALAMHLSVLKDNENGEWTEFCCIRNCDESHRRAMKRVEGEKNLRM